ncbi:MAG: tRNA dihydrouridine synthase DusB [Candidatus Cloacimonas sp. 4484_143]|nr:MAG: tRNA dihydrouridine synthase DusB [Candidatus Cloacimonas sp. 4484_143]RLC51244.1 MAG: tRNA dihydrouridine synthase DusB [Candidatus Cloacimonadota bacterium]RLC53620.1 MAG: tRNA dihydrouridine synthase DusB [Candidatus Cloacimonadota bacterium]
MPDKLLNFASRKLWLAPLAGITDNAFRTICKECGADIVVSEMISADGLIYNENKSITYAEFEEKQRPFAIQLFGSDPAIMAKAAEIVLKKKPDLIDINMGCPVKKVVKRGAGSALMQTPELAENIVKSTKSVLMGTNIPLTVKFRAGWDNFSLNAIEFGKRMEAAGADGICLHPRTRTQMFSGHSNWNLIKELKQKISIPLIGNGDIHAARDVMDMFNQTGCDDVMIGRGIMGKPWLFQEIKTFLEEGKPLEIGVDEKLKIIRKHAELTIKHKGMERAVVELRTHFAHYTKGLRGGARVRDFIVRCFDMEDTLTTIENLYLSQPMNLEK